MYRRVAPYPGPCFGGPPRPGDGCWFALPAYIPQCESGWDFHVGFAGMYGLLVATWQYFGGGKWTADAGEATPLEQHIVAHRTWLAVGPSGWECA